MDKKYTRWNFEIIEEKNSYLSKASRKYFRRMSNWKIVCEMNIKT